MGAVSMEELLIGIFCDVDNFCQVYQEYYQKNSSRWTIGETKDETVNGIKMKSFEMNRKLRGGGSWTIGVDLASYHQKIYAFVKAGNLITIFLKETDNEFKEYKKILDSFTFES